MHDKFSVLMSVYKNDKANQLYSAVESCFENQSIKPDELVLVEDGELTDELYSTIKQLKEKYVIIKSVPLAENQGLGAALSIGIFECSNEIIARMDSDDINAPNRFATQLPYMKEYDAVGMYIEEFYEEIHDKNIIKQVPLNESDILKFIKKRNPMSHMTVMFKKSKVIEAGNYQTLMYVEDYYLWVRMLLQGAKIMNIPQVGVYVRTGLNMYGRRSNKEYINSWEILQQLMFKEKMINKFEYYINMLMIRVFIYTPISLKEQLYKYLLRKR
ncbi:glycosyltransferase [Tuanshanicoccus lijuaniae]|uniref:glycosyltransferase n=1 Tax=Aerococcaceae bacterium zg-1292 TaxID=2774330 RepID=UPI001BD8338D|nr:glycosyltransferase [Aerococcaceae bacterium zg-A91]MBS4458442.1 glycosyltransferase [Aerococcaceae bacterium zg-BR33]